MISRLRTLAREVTRIVLKIRMQGILGGQAQVEGAQERQRFVLLSFSFSTDDGTQNGWPRACRCRHAPSPEVTKAVAQDDSTKHVNIDAEGEMLELRITVSCSSAG